MNYKKFAISYLWHKAVSDKDRARASLDLLLENGVGIGDHSTGDFHKNLDEALDMLVDAEDRMETLEQYYDIGQFQYAFYEV
tara:strand:+ start:750 stop:995 length:246 start_codon:yes stop_codon:yes gene_type:complete